MKKIYTHFFPFIALLIVSLMGKSSPYLATLLLLILAAVMIADNYKRSRIALFVIVAIFGPIAEAVAIYFGQWSYAHIDIGSVPLWLFPLWGCAGLYIEGLSVRLSRKFDKQSQ